jgi:NAD(P)-dependent dehydrogenase (short-subunit alcohol dehydrogenase family)
VAILPDGRIVIADSARHRLVSIDPSTGVQAEITRNVRFGLAAAGPMPKTGLHNGVAVADDGSIYLPSDTDAAQLRAVARTHSRLRIELLDATDPASVDQLGARLVGQPIDILVNNVGLLGDEDEQRLGSLDAKRFDTYMRVNALSALLVTERLLPNIRAGKLKKIAGISAVVASFAVYPRIHSGLYYYKASKSALNMILRNIALDTGSEGIAVAVLSPGVVNTYGTQTDMTAMSPEMMRSMTDIDTSVSGMMKVLDDLTVEGSGRWYRYTGEVISW